MILISSSSFFRFFYFLFCCFMFLWSVIRSQKNFLSSSFRAVGGIELWKRKRKRERERGGRGLRFIFRLFVLSAPMPGSSSSRPQQQQGGGGGGAPPPPPPPQHVPAGFDPSTGTYTQPVVYQQQPQVREEEERPIRFLFPFDSIVVASFVNFLSTSS